MREQFSCKVKVLEDKVSRLEESLVLADEDLKKKDKEFECYKHRVNKLLTQNQPPKEVEELKKLQEKFDVIVEEKANIDKKLEEIEAERNSLLEKQNEILKEKDDLIQRLDKSLSFCHENERLQNTVKDLKEQINREKDRHKIECEKIEETYRTKNSCLEKEIVNLKARIVSLEDEIRSLNQLNQSLSECRKETSTPTGSSNHSENHHNHLNDFPLDTSGSNSHVDFEGSDSCSQPDTAHRTPLSGFSSSKIPISPDNPLQEILNSREDSEEEMLKYIRQVGDLTQLLKENESNNALLTEQNRVLKEEIRRLQRSIERVEIAENLEYLKNVFIKFISSEAGKAQLIPVFTTILKLTKQEEEVLVNFATHNQNQSSSSSNLPSNHSNGWSSFIWPPFSGSS